MKRTLAVVAVALAMAGCRETGTTGSAVYFSTCSACHGVDLTGGVGSALTAGSAAADLSDAEYRTVIREGTTDMPANRGLSEAQLDALIDYIRSVQGQ